jgi:DNA-binding response OmpR family regulator
MNTAPLILVVDDSQTIRRLINVELTTQGFRVVEAEDGPTALQMASEERPDAIVLDILMPGMSGLEVLAKLRETVQVPVLMLTGKDGDADKVRGLKSGADDYLVKPFNPEELAARVRAVLRRTTPEKKAAEEVLTIGNVEIDLYRRLVKKDGVVLALTRTEWMLLQHLAANPDRTILNAELLSKVWGPEYREDMQYLRVWVSRLRSKLEADPANPKIIKNMPNVGYRLQTAEPEKADTEDLVPA